MSPLRRRWILGMLLLVLVSLVYWAIDSSLVLALRNAAIVSGTCLYASVLFLTLFNARKRVPFLPLLTASTWMQIHIYLGIFSMVLFLFHIGFRPPRGLFEAVLGALFAVVALSGVVGLIISRWLPARLTLHGENLLFERIPALRAGVKGDVEGLVLKSISATKSATISDFYNAQLRSYFEQPRNLVPHLLGNSKPVHRLLGLVTAMDRYLSPEERTIMNDIAECVRLKDNLDLQWAGQGLLKAWLFVHIPLSYSLLLIGLVHGLVAWRFS